MSSWLWCPESGVMELYSIRFYWNNNCRFFYPFFLALTRQSFSENNEMFWKTRRQAVFIRGQRIRSIKISLLSKTFLNCKKSTKKKNKNRARPTKNPSTTKRTWKNISKILSEPRQKREEYRRKKRENAKTNALKRECCVYQRLNTEKL